MTSVIVEFFSAQMIIEQQPDEDKITIYIIYEVVLDVFSIF